MHGRPRLLVFTNHNQHSTAVLVCQSVLYGDLPYGLHRARRKNAGARDGAPALCRLQFQRRSGVGPGRQLAVQHVQAAYIVPKYFHFCDLVRRVLFLLALLLDEPVQELRVRKSLTAWAAA